MESIRGMAGAALDGGPLVDGVVQRVARWKTGRGAAARSRGWTARHRGRPGAAEHRYRPPSLPSMKPHARCPGPDPRSRTPLGLLLA